MYTNRVFGTAKCVLFIKVSSFQCVLINGSHCTLEHVHTRSHTCTHSTLTLCHNDIILVHAET